MVHCLQLVPTEFWALQGLVLLSATWYWGELRCRALLARLP